MQFSKQPQIPGLAAIVAVALKDPRIARAIRSDAADRMTAIGADPAGQEDLLGGQAQADAIRRDASQAARAAESGLKKRLAAARQLCDCCQAQVTDLASQAQLAKTLYDGALQLPGKNLAAAGRARLDHAETALRAAQAEQAGAQAALAQIQKEMQQTRRANQDRLARAEQECREALARAGERQAERLAGLVQADPVVGVFMAVK